MSDSILLPAEGSQERSSDPRELLYLRREKIHTGVVWLFRSKEVQGAFREVQQAQRVNQALTDIAVEPVVETDTVSEPEDNTTVLDQTRIQANLKAIYDKEAA